MASSLGFGYLIGLAVVTWFGSIVPVFPTGAAVSVAAALAGREPVLLLVVGFGAAGAYVGDVSMYGMLRLAGEPLARRIGWLRTGATAETLLRLRHAVEAHDVPVLVTCRLIPGGRVPVLLAAALGGYSWRRYVTADILAAVLWSVLYAAVGVLGRTAFPEPWQGALAAGVLVILVGIVVSGWRSARKNGRPSS